MTKQDALSKVAVSGLVLLVIGVFVAFLGLFAYADLPNVKSIVTMMVGVLVTSVGYALLYLYYHLRSEAEYKKRQEQLDHGRISCH
jgi:multisubunit Na+/H+ antiporter MnhG subunit